MKLAASLTADERATLVHPIPADGERTASNRELDSSP